MKTLLVEMSHLRRDLEAMRTLYESEKQFSESVSRDNEDLRRKMAALEGLNGGCGLDHTAVSSGSPRKMRF